MRVFTNHRLIRRNHNIGRVLVFLGLGMFAAGFVISFTNPAAVTIVLGAAFVGMLVSQAGITFLNRWGRHPRPDEIIDSALKGLDDRFVIFHYGLGSDHFLTGPPGTFSISIRNEDGEISYEDDRLWQDRPRRGLLRRGGRSEIRDLKSDAERQIRSANKALAQHLDDGESPSVTPIMVFVSDSASVQAGPDVDDVVVLHRSKLKDWLRRANRGSHLNRAQVNAVATNLNLESE
jgi:hypothetical protein